MIYKSDSGSGSIFRLFLVFIYLASAKEDRQLSGLFVSSIIGFR